MSEPLPPNLAFMYRHRWISLALLAIGAAQWIATGDWRWIVLPVVIISLATSIYLAVHPRDLMALADPNRTLPEFTRRERLNELMGLVVLMLGVNMWVWMGEWRFAVIGAAIVALTMVTMRMRANQRRLRQEEAQLELSKRAADRAAQGRHGQAADQDGQLAADSDAEAGAGASPQDDGPDVSDLYNEAAELDREGRQEAAVDAYLGVVSRYGLDPTPTAVKLTERSVRRLRELDF